MRAWIEEGARIVDVTIGEKRERLDLRLGTGKWTRFVDRTIK